MFEYCRANVLHLSVMQLYSFAASMIQIHSTTAISFKRCTNSNVCGENNVTRENYVIVGLTGQLLCPWGEKAL